MAQEKIKSRNKFFKSFWSFVLSLSILGGVVFFGRADIWQNNAIALSGCGNMTPEEKARLKKQEEISKKVAERRKKYDYVINNLESSVSVDRGHNFTVAKMFDVTFRKPQQKFSYEIPNSLLVKKANGRDFIQHIDIKVDSDTSPHTLRREKNRYVFDFDVKENQSTFTLKYSFFGGGDWIRGKDHLDLELLPTLENTEVMTSKIALIVPEMPRMAKNISFYIGDEKIPLSKAKDPRPEEVKPGLDPMDWQAGGSFEQGNLLLSINDDYFTGVFTPGPDKKKHSVYVKLDLPEHFFKRVDKNKPNFNVLIFLSILFTVPILIIWAKDKKITKNLKLTSVLCFSLALFMVLYAIKAGYNFDSDYILSSRNAVISIIFAGIFTIVNLIFTISTCCCQTNYKLEEKRRGRRRDR